MIHMHDEERDLAGRVVQGLFLVFPAMQKGYTETQPPSGVSTGSW